MQSLRKLNKPKQSLTGENGDYLFPDLKMHYRTTEMEA